MPEFELRVSTGRIGISRQSLRATSVVPKPLLFGRLSLHAGSALDSPFAIELGSRVFGTQRKTANSDGSTSECPEPTGPDQNVVNFPRTEILDFANSKGIYQQLTTCTAAPDTRVNRGATRFLLYRFCPVLLRFFSSSNQFSTTFTCVGADSVSLTLIIKKRLPSGVISSPAIPSCSASKQPTKRAARASS